MSLTNFIVAAAWVCLSSCQGAPSKEAGVNLGDTAGRATAAEADLHPGWESHAPIEISKRAFDASNELFQSHPDYLALNTPFVAISELLAELQRREKIKLVGRGEAHVTIVTPPEAMLLANDGVNMRAIEIAAERMQLNDSELDPVCLGMGQAMINGKMERTYFIVLHSDSLLKIRRKIGRLRPSTSVEKHYEAEPFYPHITVGFTTQDLFEQNGVIKDRTSCLYPLKLMP